MKRREPDTLTPAERLAISRKVPPKIKLFLDALYISGCRVSELLSVRRSECVYQGQVVRLTIHATKTDSVRYVYVKRQLFEEILTVWQTRRSEYLFQGQGSKPISRKYIWARVKDANKRAHPHLWRHTRITDLIQDKQPLDAVSRFAGHSRLDTTLRTYGHSKLPVSVMADL